MNYFFLPKKKRINYRKHIGIRYQCYTIRDKPALIGWAPIEGGVVFCTSFGTVFCFSCKGGECIFLVYHGPLF